MATHTEQEEYSQQIRQESSNEGGLYSGYADEERPLGGYLAVMGVYAGAALACALLLNRRKRPMPEDVPVKDVALIGVASHKLSRIIAKDEVTSPLRAPFSHLEESTGASELKESTRGSGVRRAVGDLLTCPWCLDTWVASGFMAGYLFWPRHTRVVASLFAAIAVSDFMNHGYVKAKELSE